MHLFNAILYYLHVLAYSKQIRSQRPHVQTTMDSDATNGCLVTKERQPIILIYNYVTWILIQLVIEILHLDRHREGCEPEPTTKVLSIKLGRLSLSCSCTLKISCSLYALCVVGS